MARTDDRKSIRCSFCGKRQEQVERLIAGPNVYICNECVDLCNSILHDEMHAGSAQQLELPDDTTITSRRSSSEAVAASRSRSISSLMEASFSI